MNTGSTWLTVLSEEWRKLHNLLLLTWNVRET